MENINERFRRLRELCGKTQTEWASILGLSRSGIADIEAGRRNVTDKHIRLLCIEPVAGKYINEEWLKTGDGEPFKKMSPEEEVASYVSDLLEDDTENPLYEIIKEIMKTYSELSPKSQEVIRDFSQRLIDNIKKGS